MSDSTMSGDVVASADGRVRILDLTPEFFTQLLQDANLLPQNGHVLAAHLGVSSMKIAVSSIDFPPVNSGHSVPVRSYTDYAAQAGFRKMQKGKS